MRNISVSIMKFTCIILFTEPEPPISIQIFDLSTWERAKIQIEWRAPFRYYSASLVYNFNATCENTVFTMVTSGTSVILDDVKFGSKCTAYVAAKNEIGTSAAVKAEIDVKDSCRVTSLLY